MKEFKLIGTGEHRSIASIKFKFAPMLKIYRIGAKTEENSEAKE